MTYLDILLQLGLSEVPDRLHDDLDLALESSPNHRIETTTQFDSVLPLISSHSQVADVEFLENDFWRMYTTFIIPIEVYICSLISGFRGAKKLAPYNCKGHKQCMISKYTAAN